MAPMASSNSSFVHPRLRHSPPLRRRLSLTVSASFRLADLLGGRGLCNGEVGLLKELSSSPVPTTPETTTSDTPAPPLSPPPPTVDPAAFDKELMGLTGGFPGGEVGLQSFLAKNPPPSKNQETGPTGSLSLVPSRRPLPPELPLFLPGMVVIVKNPKNPFHMYTGIVQRVTDGEVGVLFEGGNWDKLFTFRLDELERRDKGPPMVNPKSAVLEPIVAAREKEEQEQQSAAAKE